MLWVPLLLLWLVTAVPAARAGADGPAGGTAAGVAFEKVGARVALVEGGGGESGREVLVRFPAWTDGGS